ncbi:MAG: hypothetical protein WD491_02565 [Balneolales bacterium]
MLSPGKGVELRGSNVSEGLADFVLNSEGTVFASAARTSTAQSSNMTNYNSKGIMLFLNVTDASGTGGLQVQLRGVDPVSGLSISLHSAPTAITSTGRFGYLYYPGNETAGVSGSPNVQEHYSLAVPRTFLVVVLHGDSSSYTYSVGYSLIL